MNDFTKEELYDLKYAIEKFRQPAKDNLGFYKLRDKIQSMIDNYCDKPETDFTLPDGNRAIAYIFGGGGGKENE